MELTGEHLLPAPRETVWRMLNDPEVLKACIPGCETLETLGPTQMTAIVLVNVGPIKARFSGEVELTDLDPPAKYSIVGEGKGGLVGFAKGRANITLTQPETGTLLQYVVHVQIGGKIAQLSSRLIASTSKKLSQQFFDCLTRKIPQQDTLLREVTSQ